MLKEFSMAKKQKPAFHLLHAGKEMTAQDVANLYEALTGEKATPEELKEMQAILDKEAKDSQES